MRNRMKEHSEETNELFNLMARQIKKRCEERINLFVVDQKEEGQDNGSIQKFAQEDIDQFLLDNNLEEGDMVAIGNHSESGLVYDSSPGNSPARDRQGMTESKSATKMQQMLASQTHFTQAKVVTVKPFRLNPNIIYVKNKRDDMLLMTESNKQIVPTCEQGYWGGFSPKRKGGKYQDQALTKKYTDGRARLYPARKMPKDMHQSSQKQAAI